MILKPKLLLLEKNKSMKNRRSFLKTFSLSSAFLLSGEAFSTTAFLESRNKVKLRFLIASDAHFGQPKTDFEGMTSSFIKNANEIHKKQKLDFCVINGDLIHDKPEFMPQAKAHFDGLPTSYFVTKGNHDRISDEAWLDLWKMPVNHYVEKDGFGLIFGNTSNEKGEYLSPDLVWLKSQLEKAKALKIVFIFIHIPQMKWTQNAIENPAFFQLLKGYPNIKAVFHGHEHDQDGIKTHNEIPYIFDSHIGGNWGTEYRGYRIVEVLKNGDILTYMMDPTNKILEATL